MTFGLYIILHLVVSVSKVSIKINDGENWQQICCAQEKSNFYSHHVWYTSSYSPGSYHHQAVIFAISCFPFFLHQANENVNQQPLRSSCHKLCLGEFFARKDVTKQAKTFGIWKRSFVNISMSLLQFKGFNGQLFHHLYERTSQKSSKRISSELCWAKTGRLHWQPGIVENSSSSGWSLLYPQGRKNQSVSCI